MPSEFCFTWHFFIFIVSCVVFIFLYMARLDKPCTKRYLPCGKSPRVRTPTICKRKKAPTIKVSDFLTFTGYSAPSIFRLLRAVSEKSSLLETLAECKTYRGFAPASPNPNKQSHSDFITLVSPSVSGNTKKTTIAGEIFNKDIK